MSDDIARHTSSISTRVSVIPGKNTVGIEIPNSKRDGVFLSEIISSDSFLISASTSSTHKPQRKEISIYLIELLY